MFEGICGAPILLSPHVLPGQTGSLSGFMYHLKPMGESHKSTGSDLPCTGQASININTYGRLCSDSSASTATLKTQLPLPPQLALFPHPHFDNWAWKAVNFGGVIFMEEILKKNLLTTFSL